MATLLMMAGLILTVLYFFWLCMINSSHSKILVIVFDALVLVCSIVVLTFGIIHFNNKNAEVVPLLYEEIDTNGLQKEHIEQIDGVE